MPLRNVERAAVVVRHLSLPARLMDAATRGDLREMRSLVEDEGVDVNERVTSGFNVLVRTAAMGQVAAVEYLVEYGCDVESIEQLALTTKAYRTALIWAAANQNKAAVKYLVWRGADVNAKSASGSTALMEASHLGCVDIVQQLVEHGADVNAKDRLGRTALSAAIDNRSFACVQLLVEHGANVNERDLRQQTVLMQSAWSGDEAITEHLLSNGANVNATDWHNRTALKVAAKQGHLAIVEMLVAYGAERGNRGRSAAGGAADNKCLGVVGYLAAQGAQLRTARNLCFVEFEMLAVDPILDIIGSD